MPNPAEIKVKDKGVSTLIRAASHRRRLYRRGPHSAGTARHLLLGCTQVVQNGSGRGLALCEEARVLVLADFVALDIYFTTEHTPLSGLNAIENQANTNSGMMTSQTSDLVASKYCWATSDFQRVCSA